MRITGIIAIMALLGISETSTQSVNLTTPSPVAETNSTNIQEVQSSTAVENVLTTLRSSPEVAEQTSPSDPLSNATEAPVEFKRWKCYNSSVPDPIILGRCCSVEYVRYTDRWINGGYYLSTILERMQRWGCRQAEIECEHPTWPFTEYTKLMYDRFCNHSKLEEKCTEVVRKVVQEYGFIKPDHPRETEITENRWEVLAESLKSPKMSLTDLAKPCIQLALFDRKDGGVGRFHEIVEPFSPFCGLQWNGYDHYTAKYRGVTAWTGLSIWCRGSIIVCIVVMAIAGLATIIGNITIIAVFATTPRLRNSQSVYKISLAVADLMVGLVVWPNMIVMQYLTFFQSTDMGNIVKHPSTANGTWVPYFPFGNETLEHRYPSGTFKSIFPGSYVKFLGFFTNLGIVVSIYTLMVASFDRFWAVFRPLRYNRHNAQRQAKIISVVVWVASVVFSIFPAVIPAIYYGVIASNFITSEGTAALVLIFLGTILPLIITWAVTILTFHSSRRHARNRQKIMSANASSAHALEWRLAKTLSLMVGIFTLCVLPILLCAVAGLALPGIDWTSPRDINLYGTTVYTTSEYISVIILTSNSLWNCFIYSLRTRGFRDASKSVFSTVGDKTGLKHVGRGFMYVIHGARRVSMSSLVTMRRFSTVSDTDMRKKSVTSMGTGFTKVSETGSSSDARPSVDMSSTSMAGSSAYSTTYMKSTSKGAKASGVEQRVERKKQQIKDEDVAEDSFGSFAVDSGADRFFNSVMENVPEEIEEANEAEQNKENERKDKN